MRPTGFGFAWLGVILSLFLLAVHYSNNLAFSLAFFLVGLALASVWITWTNLSRLDVQIQGGSHAFAGQTMPFSVAVKNPLRRARWALELSTGRDGDISLFSLAALQDGQQDIHLRTDQRGLLKVTRVQLATRFPLGICFARRQLSVPRHLLECLVWPNPDGISTLPKPDAPDGVLRADRPGDFSDIRDYARGDTLASIAWKLSARTDKLVTKTFDGGDGEPHVWLSFDQVSDMPLEAAISQLTCWIVTAQREGVSFGLSLPGLQMEPDLGDQHIYTALRALALFHPDQSTKSDEAA